MKRNNKKIKSKNTRKKTMKNKLFLMVIFIILIILVVDNFTGNQFENKLLQISNANTIKKNPNSLIITVKANENLIVKIPIISYNTINIDWGDGEKDEFKSYRLDNNENININANNNEINEDLDKNNLYNNIILPVHKYKNKGIYKIVITGDSGRGMFGVTEFTTIDKYGQSMFYKEILKDIPIYNNKNVNKKDNNNVKDYNEHINKYIELSEENNKDVFLEYNIIKFKNLNYKAIGSLKEYIDTEVNEDWIKEFSDIELFIDTFANSNISKIPYNIFEMSPNLRILSATFFNCKSLEKIPENLILNVDNIENIRYCFSNSDNITGLAPDWWNTMKKIKDEKDIKSLAYLLCFNECKQLENYNKIPLFWGGIQNNQ